MKNDYRIIMGIANDGDAVKRIDNHYGAGVFEGLIESFSEIHQKIIKEQF